MGSDQTHHISISYIRAERARFKHISSGMILLLPGKQRQMRWYNSLFPLNLGELMSTRTQEASSVPTFSNPGRRMRCPSIILRICGDDRGSTGSYLRSLCNCIDLSYTVAQPFRTLVPCCKKSPPCCVSGPCKLNPSGFTCVGVVVVVDRDRVALPVFVGGAFSYSKVSPVGWWDGSPYIQWSI